MSLVRTLNHRSALVQCDHCGMRHTVDRDEDGGAEVETEPCHDDDCLQRLCSSCATACAGCGLTHCREHMVFVGADGPYCRICMDAALEDGAVELTEQREAERFAMLAAAGLTLAEFRAAAKEVIQ